MKIMNFKIIKYCLLLLFATGSNAEAVNSANEIVLLCDTSFTSHFFGAILIEEKMQIFHQTKLHGEPNWNPKEFISDPVVSVNSFEVGKDSDNNLLVGWLGENTNLGIYSLYIRYYVANSNTWSAITMVSGVSENLTGNYSIVIHNVEAEIIWTSYDENFNIEQHSATFSLL